MTFEDASMSMGYPARETRLKNPGSSVSRVYNFFKKCCRDIKRFVGDNPGLREVWWRGVGCQRNVVEVCGLICGEIEAEKCECCTMSQLRK